MILAWPVATPFIKYKYKFVPVASKFTISPKQIEVSGSEHTRLICGSAFTNMLMLLEITDAHPAAEIPCTAR